MYYISKFCRICIQTGVKLLDLDTLDFDEVKLSEKLEVCTKMVVNSESVSTDICMHCITKLRISYQFHDMCKKSTETLQGYLEALLSAKDGNGTPKKIVKSELNVVVTPLPGYVSCSLNHNVVENDKITHNREKRKRITKEQRCSLLKRLLTPTEEFNKVRDKQVYDPTGIYSKGGLKNIIHFTRNYEFGVNLDKNSNYEPTPLDKLTAFSNEFFRKDFSEFRNTILYIIENEDNLYESCDSEDEDFFSNQEEEEEEESDTKEKIVKFEEVIVEPDIKIKTEMEFEEASECVYESYQYIDCKTEIDDKDYASYAATSSQSVTHSFSDINSFPSDSSITLLNNLVGCYHQNQTRTFSQQNVRCRTRDNPYINPLLKNQFLYRSFKCEKCNRYFKSPGYLKAHYSKVH